MAKKVFIVIPAYREEKVIGGVVSSLIKAGYENVIVVDDGSPDHTGSVAQKSGAIVVRHIINRGQGAGLKTGIEKALERGADIIVTFDADGQHRIEDIPAIVAPVASGKYDLSLGSRFLDKKTKLPATKKFALKAGTLFNWLIYGIKLSDAHNGFRALSRKCASQMEFAADKMEHASEILDEIRKKGFRYVEVPVVIRYTEYSMRKGQSFLRLVPIGFKIIMRKLIRVFK